MISIQTPIVNQPGGHYEVLEDEFSVSIVYRAPGRITYEAIDTIPGNDSQSKTEALTKVHNAVHTLNKATSEGILITRDGNKWLAVYEDFINLAVSPAGFGESQEEAVNALKDGTPE